VRRSGGTARRAFPVSVDLNYARNSGPARGQADDAALVSNVDPVIANEEDCSQKSALKFTRRQHHEWVVGD
jgi:hypothetical protein